MKQNQSTLMNDNPLESWDDYPMEVQAMMGVFALHTQLDHKLGTGELSARLGRPECHVLVILARPRRMGDLARLTMKAPSAVTAAAANLEERGYVQKVRDDTDGRVWLLELTPAGADIRDELIETGSALFYETSGLTPEEAQVLAGLARKIHSRAILSDAEYSGKGERE